MLRIQPRPAGRPIAARIALGVALSIVTLSQAALAAPRDVRPIPSGPGSARFAVAVPEARIEAVPGAADLFEIRIAGYGLGGEPGIPVLPARVLQVAVPPTGEVRVSATAGPGVVREGVLLAPPGLRQDAREEGPPRFERSAEAYAATASLAPARARLLGVSWMRDQRVATIAILPADYEPAARRVTLHREIEVEVSFDAAAAGEAQPEADPFESVYRDVLVNYEAGRAWRLPRGASPGTTPLFAAPRAAAARPGALGTPAVPDTSRFVGRDWVKLVIPKSGFYRVEFGDMRNLSLFGGATNVPLDSLRLFTWPGYPVLPEDSYCDSCDIREVAIQIEEVGTPDGIFNDNHEAIVFHAMGASDWGDLYDPAQPETVFVDHPYETRNYYYLTIGTAEQPVGGVPARVAPRSGAVTVDGPEVTPADFAARVHVEQDIEYLPDLAPNFYGPDPGVFWEKWFWRSLQVGSQFSPDVPTPGADSTQLATIRIRQWGIQSSGNCSGDAQHLMDVSVNSQPLPRQGWNGIRPYAYISDIPINALRGTVSNTVRVSLPSIAGCPGRFDRSAFAWVEVRYRRKFEPVADRLEFDSPAGGGNYIYDIGPFTGTALPRVYDVTDAYAPVEITGATWSNASGAYRLKFETVETGLRRYRVLPAASIQQLSGVSVAMAPPTSRLNLRSATQRADYLLIYYDGFQPAADSLAKWRQTNLPIDNVSPPYEVVTIPISALHDQFSGGRTDPSGIRNFMRAVHYRWSRRPAFVTFLGDASFDFKNIKGLAPAGQPGAPMPTYENGFAIAGNLAKQFTSDDWLLNVDNPVINIPEFYGGRIPATDARAAMDFVLKKVLFYERNAPTGTWRNRVMLIADDDVQPGQPGGQDPLGWAHLMQTSDLDSTHTPDHVDRDPVYLHTYPDGPGNTKPDAKAAIKESVNEGVLMFNYIGHGSPFKIADETVLSDVDAGTFTNALRPTLFVAASCDVGKFSDPTVQSLGERMVLAPNGGAVAVVSATEIAYSSFNVSLNTEFYDQLFDRSAPGGQYHESIGQALYVAKINTSGSGIQITNNSKYAVMGDAATRLLLPRLWVDLTLHDCETCDTPVNEVKRGETKYFRGRVYDREVGGNLVAIDGVADLLIEDSAPLDHAPTDPSVEYWFRAGAIFRGDARITGGELRGSFVVPIEARGGAHGRVRAYVQGRPAGAGYDTDGVGSRTMQVSTGPPVTGDNEGPRITLSFPSGSTIVRPDAVLRVDLLDPSGILITGHTLQNGIVVTLDENTTARVDITPSFRYQSGSHTSGTARWQLPNLSPGAHTIRVSAADNLAAGLDAASHRSSATISITVAETPPLQIVNAFLFPNPTQSGRSTSGGQFVVNTLGDPVNTLVKIYTLSGKLIRSLEVFGGQGQIQVPWDGLDSQGYPLANGTYFFRLQVNVRDPEGDSSAQRKASTEGRFVILNRETP